MRGLLFDLDGTLADTAPDLVAVLNAILRERDLAPIPYAIARNFVSDGAIGLLRLGFGLPATASVDETLRSRFLELYAANICVRTRFFLEPASLGTMCTASGAHWGIVTNKPAGLTGALLEALGATGATRCIVAGDTLPQKKPHPAPLLHAAKLLGLDPADCVYVGDARRDVEAGVAAGMKTIAAAYGYIRSADRIDDWGADFTARSTRQVYDILSTMIQATAQK